MLICHWISYSNVTVTMARTSEEAEARINELAEERARRMFEAHRIEFEDSLIYERYQDRINVIAERLAEEKFASVERRI